MKEKEYDEMTEKPVDDNDFTIVKDEDEGPDERGVVSTLGKIMRVAENIERHKAMLSAMGVTERIFEEDRDASNLFCDRNRRCEIHGILCVSPCCNICKFAALKGRQVCAVMDNLDELHEISKKWRKDDGKGKECVPKGVHTDTGKY